MLLYTIKLYQKEVVENFSFNELKTEKVKFSIQSPTKICCINVFNVGGCLASCLTFRPFFNVRPLVTWLLIIKNEFFSTNSFLLKNWY